ncbi:hypothetical protein MKW98_012946 [Papaver atlanticum]|uniref:Uncharacterized protein n=1 Tax=Papaver atlanticum TaxID=357466 RepID=A0AAD4SKQ3_9MAGN|nr:hypothetical protein MKW98_012946 [Papaver atlanticum]
MPEMKGDWQKAGVALIVLNGTQLQSTKMALHIAAAEGNSKFVGELVILMAPELLEFRNLTVMTSVHWRNSWIIALLAKYRNHSYGRQFSGENSSRGIWENLGSLEKFKCIISSIIIWLPLWISSALLLLVLVLIFLLWVATFPKVHIHYSSSSTSQQPSSQNCS